MRNVWIGLVLAGAAGCTHEPVTFEHQSELPNATRGVALLEDGLRGQAGMYGLTCQVQVADASIGNDYDFPSDDETVVDGGTLGDEPAVLVLSAVGAHLTFPNRGIDTAVDLYENPAIVDGALFDGGVSVLLEDGTVQWLDGDAITSVPATVDASVFGMTVTPSGTVFVGTDAGVVSTDPSGESTTIGEAADIVVWDQAAEVLYSAMAGSTVVSAIEADGTVRWTTDVGGEITSLDAMGPLAQAAVMVETNAGGELLTVDGYTGEITSSLATPGAADSVEVSGNGRTMALALPGSVHFFNVNSTGL